MLKTHRHVIYFHFHIDLENYKNNDLFILSMNQDAKRSIPVCFKPEQLKMLEDYAKKEGLLNYSQAVEKLIQKSDK